MHVSQTGHFRHRFLVAIVTFNLFAINTIIFFYFSVADPVFFGCDGKQNSGKTLDACGVCGGNNSTCTDCEGVVRPGVSVNNEKCGKYK